MKRILCYAVGSILISLVQFDRSQAAATFVSGTGKQDGVTIDSPNGNDVFLTGNVASVTAPIGGELFVAGNTVHVFKPGARSVFAAGNTVTITGGSGYNAFAAGNVVSLSGTYGHDVYAAGNSVTVEEGTVIEGDLRIGGNEVIINGTVIGSVFASGARTTSSAVIGGSFSASEGAITFSGGSIGGNLTYESEADAAGLSTLKVGGKTQRNQPPVAPAAPWYAGALWLLGSFVSTLILGGALILTAPKRLGAFLEKDPAAWARLEAYGLVALILVPLAAVAAALTVVGWKVGLILLLLYAVGLIAAQAFAVTYLGKMALKLFGMQRSAWMQLAAGALTLTVLTSVPYLGGLISLFFFIGLSLPAIGFLAAGMKEHA